MHPPDNAACCADSPPPLPPLLLLPALPCPQVYDLARAHLPNLTGPAAQGALLALAQLKYVDAPALAVLLEGARPGAGGEWRLGGAAALLVALARGGLRPSNAWLAAVMQVGRGQR
jgi:hypothetical protein